MNKQADSQYAQWLARAVGNKTVLAYYDCPYCKANVATLVPENGGVYTSFSTCPYCDGLYFKVVKNIEFVPVVNISVVKFHDSEDVNNE